MVCLFESSREIDVSNYPILVEFFDSEFIYSERYKNVYDSFKNTMKFPELFPQENLERVHELMKAMLDCDPLGCF